MLYFAFDAFNAPWHLLHIESTKEQFESIYFHCEFKSGMGAIWHPTVAQIWPMGCRLSVTDLRF